MMPKIILTGGHGFIGSRLALMLSDAGFIVLLLVKNKCNINHGKNIICKDIGDFCHILDWTVFLHDADCIIHLAARTHILKELSSNPLDDFIKTNCDVTCKLALDAANLGIKRFIYISSIGVLGNLSVNESLYNNESEYNPKTMYSVSKMKAELGLKKISKSTEMEVVIIRPPIVYGANVKGNFHRLLRLVDLGLPLPLGKVNARKSMISVKNLCDLIMKTVAAPLPRLSVFEVTDGSNWSTAELVTLIAKYMGNKRPLFSIPLTLLTILAFLVGRKKDVRKLMYPLEVDGSKIAKILNWSPLQQPEDGVKEAVEFYLSHKK